MTWIDWLLLAGMSLSIAFLLIFFRSSRAKGTPCRKCRYLAEGKWDGAASVAHGPQCAGRWEDA